ncbi:MAG: iron export ABC transporter permease subunit FetB [Planctomycetota bacterium]|nr:MAG: iron export ABC transporter permease subunit FetB [Planctomycetota bacterium]
MSFLGKKIPVHEYIELSYGQVALAAVLILVNAAISILLHLKMERLLFIAAGRTVVQLLMVGLVLEWVFRWEKWYAVIGLGTVMTMIAVWTVLYQRTWRYSGDWFASMTAMWLSAWSVTAYVLALVLHGSAPWYTPQYAIPLLGMVLGNSLNGIALGMNAFTESIVAQRGQIESLLAVGATRWEASREAMQHAMRTGTMPIINSMLVVGLVSLPGMMTGQLVSGMEPIQAVKYQIVIMFMTASATALGTVLAVVGSFYRLFNQDHQLLIHRIRPVDRRAAR